MGGGGGDVSVCLDSYRKNVLEFFYSNEIMVLVSERFYSTLLNSDTGFTTCRRHEGLRLGVPESMRRKETLLSSPLAGSEKY